VSVNTLLLIVIVTFAFGPETTARGDPRAVQPYTPSMMLWGHAQYATNLPKCARMKPSAAARGMVKRAACRAVREVAEIKNAQQD
jgi:hypothetical protein